ncbi:MAG: helix-turn-helix transcriptional regulator [Kiritimatiellae bacterium]|nr:helix-turn-helix transcriptional regulator [Kiritimatiellia bacterium]MDD5520308.1 helix-turn-helix transcriptional regulator [Kiritimatiellia bacterium]
MKQKRSDLRSGQYGTPTLVRIDLSPEKPLNICIEETPDNHTAHAHIHLALEIGILLSGHVEENHGKGWFRLDPGQVWACGSLEVHRWRVLRRAVELRFEFLPSLFTAIPNLQGLDPTAVFRNPIRTNAIGSSPGFRRAMIKLGKELVLKYRKGSSPGHAYVDLLRLLELVGKEVEKSDSPGQQPWSDLAVAGRIQPALELIEQSQGQRIDVTEAARVCCMARSSFERCFKQVTGFGFAHFALRSRLAGAAREIKHTFLPMKLIASRFGFRDMSHFCHAFVTHYGMTPGRFRTKKHIPRQA